MSLISNDQITKVLKQAARGNSDLLEQLKDKNPNLHWTIFKYIETGDTILHIASRNGHTGLMKYLIDSFEPQVIDCKNKDDKTPLHEAAQFGQYESVEFLLIRGADVNALKRADWTPLMLACTKINENTQDRLTIVRLLLNKDAIVNYQNKDGWTALHLVSREGDINILKLLLQHEANVNLKTANGRTPLHIACLHGNIEIVEELCSLKIDINIKDRCGNTPLHDAVSSNQINICKELVKNGADTMCRNNLDFSLLHVGSSQGYIEMVEYVVDELHLNVNDVTSTGISALHCAARYGHEKVYKYLIDLGIDENLVDNFGRAARNL